MHGRISGGFCRGVNMAVELFHLCLVHIDLHAAKHIYDIGDNFKIYGHIMLNIQIQAGIQHTDGLLRAAKRECAVRLMEIRRVFCLYIRV